LKLFFKAEIPKLCVSKFRNFAIDKSPTAEGKKPAEGREEKRKGGEARGEGKKREEKEERG